MNNKGNSIEPLKKVEKTKFITIGVVIVILAFLNSMLYYEYIHTKTTLKESDKIKSELQKEVAEIKAQFNIYSAKSEGKIDALDKLIELRNKELQEKVAEIEKLIKQENVNTDLLIKAKHELALLKTYKDHYIQQMDSVFKSNETLITQNIRLQKEIAVEKETATKIKSENINLANTIAIASKFKIYNVAATGVKIRGDKEKETLRSKSIEKIRICFTIQENLITEKGLKDFYVRIIGPDGAILSHKGDDNDTFLADGQKSLYSIVGKVDYTNEEQDVCMYWDKGGEYLKGNYLTEVYENGNIIGKTGFVVK